MVYADRKETLFQLLAELEAHHLDADDALRADHEVILCSQAEADLGASDPAEEALYQG